MAVYVRSELWMELNFNIEVVENEFVKESRYYYYFRRNVYIYIRVKKSRYYFIRRKVLYIEISSYFIKGKRDWGGKWRYIHSEKVVDEVKF